MVDKEDTMKARFVNHCPLSSGTWMCHPSCNWWNGIRCTYTAPVERPNVISSKEKLRRKGKSENGKA